MAPVVCFFAMTHGDWGGGGRVLFTNLRLMSRNNIEPLVVLSGDGPVVPELEERGIRHVIWGPLSEPTGVAEYVSATFRAIRFFRREKVKLVHVNSSNFWRPAELLAAWLLGIPIITHYHMVNDHPSPGMRLSSAAICVSRYVAENSLPKKLAKRVIYNPVDLSRFDKGRNIRATLGLAESDIVVSFLGQVREIKGVRDYIAMARRIDNPSVRFLIAGEARDPERFPGSFSASDLLAMSGDDDRIRYVGYIKAVEDVYHSSDIVVVPSRWQEPLGLINLEAGACGKPVVATRVGGIPEVIKDKINGFLVDPGDVEGLTARVSELIASPDLRSAMGQAARQRVVEYFTTKPVEDFEAFLLSFVGLKSGAQASSAS